MSLLYTRIATIALLALFLTSSTMALVSTPDNLAIEDVSITNRIQQSVAESANNLSIPYVDRHYGSADGIIDPYEYANNYTDPSTGITTYIEHNGTTLYIGLSAPTSGWIGFGWQNYTDLFSVAGLNNSDLVYGYAPGTPFESYWRAIGTDSVTVHYVLSYRNGTIIQENDYPSIDSTDQLDKLSALQMYKDMIHGMRIGEVRHFVIPADQAYTTPTHELYGEDLEYVITLTRITRNELTHTENPALSSRIVYSDQHGISTLQHLEDADQSRIAAANASDTGSKTEVEYIIRMNSTDADDISLIADADFEYPFIFMYGSTENFDEIPVQRTHWTNPALMTYLPNQPPEIILTHPTQDAVLGLLETFKVDAIDTYVRSVKYKIDDANWTDMSYNFLSGLWEEVLDMTEYENGAHLVSFNATDPSNMSSVVQIDVTVDLPYIPVLGTKISVSREVVTEIYHRTYVSDIFTIRNNGSAPLSALEVFLPAKWASHFLSIEARDTSGTILKVTNIPAPNGMLHWRVHFSQQIDYDESFVFSTVTQMHSLDTLLSATNKKYSITYLKYPVVPYVITKASLVLTYKTGDQQASGTQAPDTTTSNLAPMTIEEFSAQFTSYDPELYAEQNTIIRTDPWGWLAYKETITIHNVGPNPETSVIFQFPTYATEIRVFDGVGLLAESMTSIEGDFNSSRYVTIDLRRDRFGDDGLLPGFKYTFNIEYVVQLPAHEELVGGTNLLTIPMGSIDEMLVKHHIVDVVVPPSFITLEASPGYRLLYGVFDAIFRYEAYNVSEYNSISITMLYQVSFNIGARPFAISIIIGLVALAYVAYRIIELPESVASEEDDMQAASEKRQVGAPSEVLSEFATLYSKKTALNLDLEKLEAARRRGKVKKREFMIRERDLKAQLEEIDSKLPEIKEELSKHGSKYRDLVGQLELQNEKIEGAKAGLRQLLLRKKKQRISRAAFEKSRQDYLKTIQKATTAIDRTLLSIQEEAGDI
ncbi:MAG: hypothetical protein EAX95_00455 [Candidatus Thorarchaeota archaeon]|nr:hypothetical protein [Candidatus Thorarchaeota archaeon]